MTWFLIDYEYNDHVHLFTYDLVDENVGCKLTWGCLFVYPFFYPIGIFPLVGHTAADHVGTICLVVSLALYSFGSFLTRGANLQKYYFKVAPGEAFFGVTPKVIGGKVRCSFLTADSPGFGIGLVGHG
jgi:delta14-sterol reductase